MVEKIHTQLARLTPAQALFLLSPVLGELVSGYLSPLEFFNPIYFVITVVPYGCGALIVRELLVRHRKGWISLILLGMAFGLFFETIVTRVLFITNGDDMEALADYQHFYGFNWTMAIGVIHFHTAISITSAILIAEMLFPDQRAESWISNRVLTVCCLLLPGWSIVLGLLSGYHMPLIGALVVVGVTAALIALALIIPAEPLKLRLRRSYPPITFGLIGGVGMTLIMLGTYMIPELDSRPPMGIMFAVLIGLVILEFGAITVLNNGGTTWTDRERLGLVIGFLAFFLVFALLQDLEGFRGRVLVGVAAMWELRRLWRHLSPKAIPPTMEVA